MIMGPNGAGKSTLGAMCRRQTRLRGDARIGRISRQDLLDLEPHERAAAGLFLGFQYPVEIPGAPTSSSCAKLSTRSVKCPREEALSGGEFLKLAKEKAGLLKIDMEMLKRR